MSDSQLPVPEPWMVPLRQEATGNCARMQAAGSLPACLHRGSYHPATASSIWREGALWSNHDCCAVYCARTFPPCTAWRYRIHTPGTLRYGEPIYADDSPTGLQAAVVCMAEH